MTNKLKIRKEFLKAKKEKRAILAFNFNNLESLKGIIEAAEEKKYLVIAQVTESAAKYIGYDFIAAFASVVKESKYVIFHWDHGFNYEDAIKMVKSKIFNSVMHDSSILSWQENVEHSQQMVKLGNKYDVWIESEIGKIGGKEDDHEGIESAHTTVEEAINFTKLVKPDMLAIAVGTAHGYYKNEVKVNLERIREINEAIKDTFLVLHGGSGVPDNIIKEAIKNGIVKINIGTEIAHAYYKGINKWMKENPDSFDSRKFGRSGIEAVKSLVKQKIDLCSS